ncbi:MAG TPA: ABC transporter substrate-binding protein [Saprospiraceae bacterium]|nr:ABC transporter substrate-binding protein [Saprospiraceae bacterium]
MSCKSDRVVSDAESIITVRLPSEPDMLNPARSSSSYATQIESHIMYPLAELDPQTYTLMPLLIETLANTEPITQGLDSGGTVFHYKIRDEASWDDGIPVTGYDYAFTIKMALNPKVDNEVWRGFLTVVTNVQVDPVEPKKFDVIIAEPYFLAEVVACNFNIYPAHIYDSTGYLKDIPVRLLTNPVHADSLAKRDPRLLQFAESFMQVRFANEVVSGSGPYRLASWLTGQRIILERKSDWWGDKVQNKPTLMNAYPQRIIYEIVPDENTALTMVKDGSIDVIAEVSPSAFIGLRSDSAFQDRLQFLTPKIPQYYCLELNNKNSILRERNVRKALSHVVDYQGIIDNVAQGMAQRTIGPFHPDVEYYNHTIVEVPFDLAKAKALLAEAGWSDTNGNGVLDKVIEGKRTELNLDITVSQRPEGQAIALLLKENAAKVGIEIDIVTKDGALINQDARNRTFEILPSRPRSDVTLVDPFQNWHSNSDAPGGNNRCGFRNAEADSLMTVIRATESATERNTSYKALQRVLAEEQPVIFLYVPLERLIVTKQFEMQPSSRRPGYFENLFVRADL